MVWNKVHQVQRKQTDSHKVCSKCPPLAQTQAQKILAIGQMHYESAAAPSQATHAADTIAAHQCHKPWYHTQLHTLLNENKIIK